VSRIEYAATSDHSRIWWIEALCGIMVSFGKPVAEQTSDAIQARRAMGHHGSSKVDFSSRCFGATFLRLCPSQSHSRLRFCCWDISACEARFPNGYRGKYVVCSSRLCFRRMSTMFVR